MNLRLYKAFLTLFACLLLGGCVSGRNDANAGETDSGCWAEVPAPALGDFDVEIGGIAAVSANDIWAVGQQANSQGGSRTLTMRWDGERWAVVPSPNGAERGESKNQLYAVAASSGNEAWAVGAYTEGAAGFRNLAMRWDGERWQITSPPSPGLIENGLNAVDMLGGSDAWAVGTQLSDEGKDPQIVIFRWNGTAWDMTAPPEQGSHNLLAVQAPSRSEAWAAGTEVLRWNGREWQQVPTPIDHPGGYLDGILVKGPEDVWVTGNDGNEAIAVRWSGSRWTGGNLPRLADGPFPHDIAALDNGEIWIGGEYAPDPTYSLPMLQRWDGSAWRAIANPLPGRSARLQGLAVVGDTLWAAGTQRDAQSKRPLFLRRTATPCVGK